MSGQDQGYFAIIPAALIAEESISMAAKLAFGVVASLARREGYAWVGNAELGRMVGGKTDRAARGWLAELEAAGWLRIEEPAGKKRRLRPLWTTTGRDQEEGFREQGKKLPGTRKKTSTDKDNEQDKDPPGGAAPSAPPAEGQALTTQEGNALNPGEVFKRAWPMFMAAAPGGRFVEGSYAKEAVALKRLIAEAFKRAPAAPLAWLLEYLKAWRARAARDPFFRDRPEIPSTLASSGMAAQIIGDMEGRGRAGARSGIDPEAVPL